MKICPFCHEQIQDDAIKCRYCSSSLLPVQPESAAKPAIPPVRPDQVVYVAEKNQSVYVAHKDQMVYVVDQGLIQFGKFVAAIIAIFLAIGAAFYGFNAKEAADRIQVAADRIRGVDDQVKQTKELVDKHQADYESKLRKARSELVAKEEEINAEAEQAKQTVQALVEEDEKFVRERHDYEQFVAGVRGNGASSTLTSATPSSGKLTMTVGSNAADLAHLYDLPSDLNGHGQTAGSSHL